MEALIAFAGVLVGTIASVGFQILDKRNSVRVAALAKSDSGAVQLLDAVWQRLMLILEGQPEREQKQAAHSAYIVARTRYIYSGVKDALVLATWVDLVLTYFEEDQVLTYGAALKQHGQVTEAVHGWQVQDAGTVQRVRIQREELKALFWADEDTD